MNAVNPTASVSVSLARGQALDAEFRRWQWRALIGVVVCYLFYYTGRQTFGFAIPGLQADLGLSKQTLGWVSATMLWAYALGQSINGNLGDKFGGRTMMLMGALLSFAANIAVSFADSLIFLLIAWGANGFFQAMGFAPGARLLSNWWGHSNRGMVYGAYISTGGFSTAITFFLPIMILGPMGLDWHWIFRLPVFLMLLGAIFMYFYVCERPEDRGMKAPQDDRSPEEERATARAVPAEETQSSRQRYATVLKNWRLYVTGASIGFQNAARYALIVWVPVHFFGMDWKTSGSVIDPKWITLALPIGMAFGAMTNSWISDLLFQSKRYLAIISYMLVATAIATSMSFVAHGSLAGMILLFLCGFFVFGPASSFWALCPDIFGRRLAGTATGVLNTISYAFAGLGEPAIGKLIDVSGQTSVIFPFVAGLCLLSAAFAFMIKR